MTLPPENVATPEQDPTPTRRPSRSGHHRIGFNIFSNWVTYGTNLAISFLIAPLMVRHLGDAGYGVWVFGLQIGAYLSVLDFGIRIAVTRFLTHHHTRGEHDQVNRVVSVALVLLSGLALFCVLASSVVSLLLPRWMHLQPALAHDARWVVFLIGISIAVTFPGALFSGALASLSRYDLLNSCNVFTAIVQNLLYWWFLVHGYGLLALASIFLFQKVLSYSINFVSAWNVYGGFQIAFHRGAFRETTRVLMKFSVFAFLLSISSRLLLWSDNVVLGLIRGPAAVTYYAIGGNLVDSLRSLLSTITSVFVPLATSFDAKSDRKALANLLEKGTKFTFLIVYPVAAGYFIYGKPFITLWMGAKYAAISGTVLALLSVPVLFAPVQATCNQILYGMNRHRFYARLAIVEALTNLALSIVLAYKIGIIGVAWGTLIPAVIIEGFLLPLYTLRQLDLKPGRYYWETLLRPVVTTLPYLLALITFRRLGWLGTWSGFFGTGITSIVIYALCAWLWVITVEERRALASRFRPMRAGNRVSS